MERKLHQKKIINSSGLISWHNIGADIIQILNSTHKLFDKLIELGYFARITVYKLNMVLVHVKQEYERNAAITMIVK